MRVLRFAALASCASSLCKGPIGVKMVDVAGDGAALVVDSYADAAVLVDVVRCAVLGVRLLDAGAQVDRPGTRGKTPLYGAAEWGNVATMRG